MPAHAAGSSRTFRVFLSSTFSDFKAERDALQRYVFPRLAELCASRNARFQAIDLRWGVSEEAALDQRAIPICLTEIERCQRITPRPNFIVLLGDRYGWRPLPWGIAADEFEALLAQVPAHDAAVLVWNADQPTDAKGWYRRDDNAVPTEYLLRPRETPAEIDPDRWAETEASLRRILLPAIERLGWSADDPRLATYVSSATEQEIVRGALEVPDAKEHVFGFFRSIWTKAGTPLTKAVPPDGSAGDFIDQRISDAGVTLDADANDRLVALKTRLDTLLGDNVVPYSATWTGSGISFDHIGDLPATLQGCLALLTHTDERRSLCRDVWRSMAAVILAQLERLETVEPGEAEVAAHLDFGAERCRDFVGRDEPLAKIAAYLAGDEPRPLALIGEPGSGKSALMARALEKAVAAHPDAESIVRFIGATPGASDGRSLLGSICLQIARVTGGDESAIPAEYNDLAVEFGRQLAKATAAQPLLVFLDALDQLGATDPARGLAWLPGQLPEHVRLVVSSLPGDCEGALHALYPEPRFLSLDRMTRAEGDTALGIWLAKVGRTLREHQRREVLDRFEPEGRPLYLKLAFEEARRWHADDEPAATRLQAGIPELISGDLLPRLEAPENHGALLVAHALGYLAASRYGLSEDELLDVLSADKGVIDDFQARSPKSPPVDRLPVVVWSRLSFDLARYLSEHAADGTTLLAFYHRVLGEAAREQYLGGADGQARHAALADYFRGKADPAKDRTWTGGSVRGLGELPFHLAGATALDELYATLTDFHFLEHKAAEVGVAEHRAPDGATTSTYDGVLLLQDDYALALPAFGGSAPGAREPLYVTGVDLGEGLVVRCPWCAALLAFEQGWRGTDIACPQCAGPLRVNAFVVGDSQPETER